MELLITLLLEAASNTPILFLLVLLGAIVVAGMSVYGMTIAIKAIKGSK